MFLFENTPHFYFYCSLFPYLLLTVPVLAAAPDNVPTDYQDPPPSLLYTTPLLYYIFPRPLFYIITSYLSLFLVFSDSFLWGTLLSFYYLYISPLSSLFVGEFLFPRQCNLLFYILFFTLFMVLTCPRCSSRQAIHIIFSLFRWSPRIFAGQHFY